MSGTPGERRLLILIDEYEGEDGGTEGQVAALLRGLPAPWAPRLWALRNAPYFSEEALPCPTRVIGLPGAKHPLFFRRLRQLARQIRAEGVELVHAFMVDGALYGPLLARWAGVPVITSRRDLGYWYTPRKLDLLRMVNRSAHMLLCNAEAVAELTRRSEWVPHAKVRVIANGHDPRRFEVPADPTLRERLGIGPDIRLVGLVANFRPLKRQPDLVEALATLGRKHADVHVLFLGEGDDAEVRAKARELGIESRVHVLQPGKAVVPILQELEVGVLCSESEGLSNAIIEYMACGLPVVATDVGGNPELVADGETGRVVPPANPTALGTALAKILKDPEGAERMGAAGRARFLARYTIERMVADTVQCYEEVVTGPRRSDDDLRVELVTSTEALAALRAEWDALLRPGQLFLGPTWALTWLEVSGAEALVPVVRDAAGELVGLVPWCRDGRDVAFCGAQLGADHLDVVAREDAGEAVAELALAALRDAGVRRLRLAHLSADGALRRVLHRPALPFAFTERLATLAHHVEPQGTFDELLAEKYSRGARKRFRRLLEAFEARPDAGVEVITGGAAAQTLLDRVLAVHGVGLTEESTFDTELQRRFHAQLIPAFAAEGRLLGLALTAEGRDLAIDYMFRDSTRIYAYQSGMAPDEATPSPGTLLAYLSLRDHVFAGDGLAYDFLDGDEDYKRRWKTGTRLLYDVVVDLQRRQGGVRGALAGIRTLAKQELKRRLGREEPASD